MRKKISTYSAGLFFVTIFFWFYHHTPLPQFFFIVSGEAKYPLNLTLPFFVTLIIIGIFFGYLYATQRSGDFKIRYSFLTASIGFIIFSCILFNVFAYAKNVYPLDIPTLDSAYMLRHNINFLWKILAQLSWISVFLLAVYLLGLHLGRRLSFSSHIKSALLLFSVNTAFGFWAWSMIILILGYAHMLSMTPFIIIFALLTFIERETIKTLLKKICVQRELPIHVHDPRTWIGILLFFFTAITFLDSFQPDPAGYDDTVEYLNKAHLMAEYGSLIIGGKPFVFSLFATVSYIFSGDAMFAFGNNIAYTIIGSLSLYGLLYSFSKDAKASLSSMSLWVLLPMTTVFLSQEIKPDILLFFLSTTSLWTCYEWTKDTKNTQLLYLTYFLLGMAITVKLTALFMFIPIGLWTGVVFVATFKKETLRETLKTISKAIFFAVLPLIIWIALAAYTNTGEKPTYPYNYFASTNVQTPTIDQKKFQALGINVADCSFTGYTEDMSRFSIKPITFKKIISLPWNITMNTNGWARLYIEEIGFVFFIITILFVGMISSLLFARKEITRTYVILLSCTISYWIAWFLFGNNILWYAYPGFVFFCIMTTLIIMFSQKNIFLRRLLYTTIIFQVIIFSFIRTAHTMHPYTLIYTAENENYYKKGYGPIPTIVNTHPEGVVYVVGSRIFYYINNNHNRVLSDQFLDFFTCLDIEKNDEKTLERLQSLDISYIIYNRLTPTTGKNTGTLNTKSLRFIEFAEKNLVKESEARAQILFSTPQ